MDVFEGDRRVGAWKFRGWDLPDLLWQAAAVAAAMKARVREITGEGGTEYSLPWLRSQLREEADRRLASLFGDVEGQRAVDEMLVLLLAVARERSVFGRSEPGKGCERAVPARHTH